MTAPSCAGFLGPFDFKPQVPFGDLRFGDGSSLIGHTIAISSVHKRLLLGAAKT